MATLSRFLGGLALCFFAATLGFYLALAGRQEVPEGYEATEIQGLCVRQHVLDVGKVNPDQLVDVEFELLNTGDASHTIKRIRSSCGCVTANLARHTVLPGRNLLVPMKVDTSLLAGASFQKSLWVRFVTPKGSQRKPRVLQLQLRGTIDRSREVSIWPGILDFGEVCLGGVATKSLFLLGDASLLTNLPASIHVQEAEHKDLCVRHELGVTGREARKVRVVLAVRETADLGKFNGALTIRFETREPRQFVVPVRGRVCSRVVVSPRLVYVPLFPEKRVSADVKIRSVREDEEIVLEGVETDLPLAWDIVEASGPVRTLVLRVRPAADAGETGLSRGHLTVRLQGLEPLRVPIVLVPVSARPTEGS